MAIGEWNPEQKTKPAEQVDTELLKKIVRNYSPDLEDNPTEVATLLDAAELSAGAPLMTLDRAAWDCVSEWDTAELQTLVKFFTLAEMQLPGWKGGNKSPVIALVKILKLRDGFTAELRQWVKANTDNRYLPHGSVL